MKERHEALTDVPEEKTSTIVDQASDEEKENLRVLNNSCLNELQWVTAGDEKRAINVSNYLQSLESLLELTDQFYKGHYILFSDFEKLQNAAYEIEKKIKIAAYDRMVNELDENQEIQEFPLVIDP